MEQSKLRFKVQHSPLLHNTNLFLYAVYTLLESEESHIGVRPIHCIIV